MRIIVLVALIITGICIGIVMMGVALVLSGENLASLMDQSKLMGGSAGRTRFLLMVNHVTMFLLPALTWSLIYYKKKWFTGLGLKPGINWIYALAGIVFLMISYPIVAKSYEINQSWQLPVWMDQMEGQTAELLKSLLVMDHPIALLSNVLVIALIPGIGEELVFRGIIQKELQNFFKSPIIAVIVASFIFSAMHFQFGGFLPRFLLGLILGLLFYWTNNLWISILVHAFNNAFQVVLAYFNPAIMDQDFEKSVPISWYALLASVVVTALLGWWFHQNRVSDSPEIIVEQPTLNSEEQHSQNQEL